MFLLLFERSFHVYSNEFIHQERQPHGSPVPPLRWLFHQYQSLYIAPAVEEYWEHMKNDLWRELGEMMGEMIHMGRHGIKVYFRDEDNRCQGGWGQKKSKYWESGIWNRFGWNPKIKEVITTWKLVHLWVSWKLNTVYHEKVNELFAYTDTV